MDTISVRLVNDTSFAIVSDSSTSAKAVTSTTEIVLKKDEFSFENFCKDCLNVTPFIWPVFWVFVVLVFRKVLISLLEQIKEKIKHATKVILDSKSITIEQTLAAAPTAEGRPTFGLSSVNDEKSYYNVKNSFLLKKIPEMTTGSNFEELVYMYLYDKLGNSFGLFYNKILGGKRFDLILTSRSEPHIDIVIEVKYYSKQIVFGGIEEAKIQVQKLAQLYKYTMGRDAAPLLIVIQDDNSAEKDKNRLSETYKNYDSSESQLNEVTVLLTTPSTMKNEWSSFYVREFLARSMERYMLNKGK